MEMLDQLFKIVGQIIIGGGVLSLIVYQVFKRLASKWLDAKFDERLQDLKHQHNKEIEQLRFKISALLDRTTKLHQKEFEVLPEAWSKLNDAFWEVRSFVDPVQRYPDFNRMSKPHQEEYISSSQLSEWQKAEIRYAKDKNERFQEHIFWHNVNRAKDRARGAHTYLRKNGIFLTDEIRARFGVIDDLMWKALTRHQTNLQYKLEPLPRKEIDQFLAEGEEFMKELERLVHDRIWPTRDAVVGLPSITQSQDTSELKR